MHFCVLRRNSRWPPKMVRKQHLREVASGLFRYTMHQKFRQNRTITEINVFLCFTQNRKFNSKLNFYKLIPYLVDRCICPAPCRSRQTLEKNVLSWALAGTGSVLFTRQVAVQPTCRYTAHACACALPLFVVYLMTPCWL